MKKKLNILMPTSCFFPGIGGAQIGFHNLAKKFSVPDTRYFRMYILGAHRHKPHVKKFHFTLAGGHVVFVPISGRFDC